MIVKEKGQIIKKGTGNLSIALVYPNNYYIGMSNLGFLSAYKLFNEDSRVNCERFFFEKEIKIPMRSIENNRKINDFNAIAFSVSFELDIVNILKIIKFSGLNLKWQDRNDLDPIIMVGGPVASINPLPLFPFIDLFCLGDGEELIPIIIDILCKSRNKQEALELFNEYDGFIVPKFYQKNLKKKKPLFVSEERFKPLISPIITDNTEFANTYLIEIMRGCPQGCRFCWIGYFQLPWKFHSLENLVSFIHNQIQFKNNEKIGLIAPSSSDYPNFLQLVKEINKIGFKNVSFSSLKFSDISDDFLNLIRLNKIKTLTFAPETGSERLKNVINKNINNFEIIDLCSEIAKASIKNIKLYFLLKIPKETTEDIQESIELIKTLQSILINYDCNLSISFNFIIPKPMTPFQFINLNNFDILKKKAQIIEDNLKKLKRLRFSIMNPEEAYYQNLLSMGNEKVANFLLKLLNNESNWRSLVRKEMTNYEEILFNSEWGKELLKFHPVEYKISPNYLYKEFQKAEKEKLTSPCPRGNCHRCYL